MADNEDFVLYFGGGAVKFIIFSGMVLIFLGISFLVIGVYTGKIFESSGFEVVKIAVGLSVLTVIPCFFIIPTIKNYLLRNPSIVYQRGILYLYLSGEKIRIIKSDWEKYTEKQRLKRPLIQFVLEKEITREFAASGYPAIVGRFEDGFVISTLQFSCGTKQFRRKISNVCDKGLFSQ